MSSSLIPKTIEGDPLADIFRVLASRGRKLREARRAEEAARRVDAQAQPGRECEHEAVERQEWRA